MKLSSMARVALLAVVVMPFIGMGEYESTAAAQAQAQLQAHDQSPITEFDIQSFIDKRLAAGDKQIVVPPGRYRVKPRHTVHLLLKNLDGVQIVADGVEMICTQTTRALEIDRCRNLIVRGLVIDYDPLPFTQGRITAMSADRRTHDVELFAGYPRSEGKLDRYEIYRPDTRTLRTSTYAVTYEAIDPTHVRITKKGNSSAEDAERVGDLIVMSTSYAPDGSAAHTIAMESCINLRMEKIVVYASNCFGYLEDDCDGTEYDHCVLDRCPPELDLVHRADPRIRSTDADAYHSNRAVRGPKYIGCIARYQGDDCVNIHGEYYMVMQSSGSELRVLAGNKMNIAAGDPVEVYTYEGKRLADAKALSVESNGVITAAERQFLHRQNMNEQIKTTGLANAYRIKMEAPLDLPMGSVICSLNHTGRGFLVKDCTFGFNRSRGILIKASDGDVIGNTIVGSQMQAILVTPEYWWMEAGSSNNVRIANNTIRDCGTPALSVIAQGGSAELAPAGAHRNIQIIGNRIEDCARPAIFVSSTDGLTIQHNTITAPGKGRELAGWLKNAATRPATGEYPPVITMETANETVEPNTQSQP